MGSFELVEALAVWGGFTIYILIGALIGYIVFKFFFGSRYIEEIDFLIAFSVVFWPFAIIVGIIYLIGMWIIFPLIGATKVDLRNTEIRLEYRIDKVKRSKR